MVARRRAVCLVLAVLGGLCLLWASGVVFWLTLGVVMVGLAGVLLPVQSRRARFAPIALVIGSMTVGLALPEFALWLWEAVSYEPLPAFDAETADVPLAPDLPPEIRAKIARMQSAVIMPPTWQKRDLAKLPGTNPYIWHGVLHHIDANGMRREEPFAPRDPSRFRIMVVGDSFAYWPRHRCLLGLPGAARAGLSARFPGRGPQSRSARLCQREHSRCPAALRAGTRTRLGGVRRLPERLPRERHRAALPPSCPER
jgi:hypothetical protein